MPQVSVVVPFHNVIDYFRDSLESLRRQTHTDLDIVLVDDESTDGSRAVAEEYAERDRRFRVVSQRNQGAGPARNLGVREARGDFLAFADADDVVHLDAYRRMLRRLTETGSDLAVCRAIRFTSHGASLAQNPHLLLADPADKTSIRDSPLLGLDRMVWNKLYRRDFWDRTGLEFWNQNLEDYPVSSRAHVSANAVDMMADRLYYWREREGGELSGTRRFAEMPRVRARVNSALAVLDTIAQGAPGALPLVARGFAQGDIPALARAVQGIDAAHDQEVIAHTQRLQARLGHAAYADLPPFYQILPHLIDAGDVDGILAMNDHFSHRSTRAEVELSPTGEYVETFPVLGSPTVPRSAFVRQSGSPEIYVSVDDCEWREAVLHLDLLIRSDLRLGSETDVAVSLVSDEDAIPLHSSRHEWRRPLVGKDLVGLRTEIDASTLDLGVGRAWRLRVEVDGPRIRHSCHVAAAPLGRGQFVPTARIPDRSRLLATFGRFPGGEMGVKVIRPAAQANSVETAEGAFLVRGWFNHASDETPEVLVRVSGSGPAPLDLVAEVGPQRAGRLRRRFQVSVPVDSLINDTEYDSPVGDRRLFPTRLVVDGAARELWTASDLAAGYSAAGSRLAMAGRSLSGQLEFGDFRLAPLLESVTWRDQTLVLSGRWLGKAALPDRVTLEHFEVPSRPDRLEVPLTVGPDGTFEFTIDCTDLVRRQTSRPDPYDGRGVRPWHLLMSLDDRRVPLLAHRTAMASFAAPRTIDDHRVSWKSVYADVFQLAIR